MTATIQPTETNLRTEITKGFERVLGAPLPVFARRRQIEQLGIRSVASLNKDACEGTGVIEPDGKIGNQPVFLVSKLIDIAVASCTGTKRNCKPPQIA